MGHPAPIICQIANFLCQTEREFLEFFKGHPTFACSPSKEELGKGPKKKKLQNLRHMPNLWTPTYLVP